MRIGFFTDSYRPYTSGVVRSIDTFAYHLRNNGHQVYIFAPRYQNGVKEPFVYRFVSVPSPTNQEFSIPIPISIKAGKTIKELGLDIIHVHSPFMMGALGALQAKRLDLPLVMTYHTLYDQYVHYLPFARNASKWAIRLFIKDYCNKCDLVIAPTNIIGEKLLQSEVKVPIKTIPTGIEIKEFQFGDKTWLRNNYGVNDEEIVLLSVGRMGAEKNIAFLLESFKKIHDEQKNTRLILVGSGPQKEEFHQLAGNLGIGSNVIFTGMLDRNKIINCFTRADLFVFASITETQGIVLAEAKAAGLPVVAVSAFGAKEMVRHNQDGILVSPDLEEFKKAVIELITNKQKYQRMADSAILNVQELSAEKSAEKLISAYEELCSSFKAFPKVVS